MSDVKTKPGSMSAEDVIAAIPSESKRNDARALLAIFQEATGAPPVVWGGKMIGFGRYSYRYASGHHGEAFVCGFAVNTKITLYLYMEEKTMSTFLTRLGKVRAGKSCVYVNKLADIDTSLLPDMIRESARFVREVAAVQSHYLGT